MNLRQISLFVATICFSLSQQALGGPADGPPDRFAGLETPEFQFISAQNCRDEFVSMSSREPQFKEGGLAAWAPTGSWDRNASPGCGPRDLERAILTNSNASSQRHVLGQFFGRCETQLKRNSQGTFGALYWLSSARYDLCENPSLRKAVIRLPSGTRLRAFLGLQDTDSPRPLVIIRCGVLCNAGDVSHRFMLMHLFDASPFHVLAIGNVTGADYVRDNAYLALGGLDEGTQIMQLVQMIKSGPLAAKVSSIHLSGVSLGAQGLLYATAMNDATAQKPISSTLAICPVVDLQTSMRELFTPPLLGRVARWLFFQEVFKVITSAPILRDLFPNSDADPSTIPDALMDKAFEYYSKLPRGWAPAPFDQTSLSTKEDLWAVNRFQKLPLKAFKTPTLAFSSSDDPIVSSLSNAVALGNAPFATKDSGLQVMVTPGGSHCAMNMTYGWPIATSLYRSFILSHSPELLSKQREVTTTFPEARISWWSKLWTDEVHDRQEFIFEKGESVLKIRFWILAPAHENGRCYQWVKEPWNAEPTCFRYGTTEVPFSELTSRDTSGKTIAPPWARVPKSDTEAEILTRWANGNLRVVDSAGRSPATSASRPSRIEWISYED